MPASTQSWPKPGSPKEHSTITAAALRRGQSEGTVRRDLDARETASFLIAMYEGYVMLAKNAQDVNVWNVGIRNIVGWLVSLRVPKKRTG